LKNAIDRGHSLEQAKQTLLNSGYGADEVNEATNFLTGGQTTVEEHHPEFQPEQQTQTQQYQQPVIKKPKKKFPFMLIFLIFVLLVLVSSLVLAIVFREDLISLFKDLF
jgi:nitrogen fixation/metabolism regulation signal transduction histidine kinase